MTEREDDDWTGVPDDVDELLERMRAASLPIEHTLYASIHDTEEEMDEIAGRLHEADVARWHRLEVPLNLELLRQQAQHAR
jgi:hypothetical protein